MPTTHTQWTEDETSILLANYQEKSKDEMLQLLPAKTHIAIERRAHKHGLIKTRARTRIGNLERLLEDTSESYYWIGFILADGYLRGTGQCTLNICDKDLIDAFCKYINYTGSIIEVERENHELLYSLTIYNKQVVTKLKQKFNISDTKTYNPPNLQNLSIPSDLLTALIIGYIDGDGSIKIGGYTEMECHKTWLNEYNYFATFLKTKHMAKLNYHDQAYLCLSVQITKDLKEFAIKHSLPILKRKWDRVKS